MHDAARTPYLTLLEAIEEATFLPNGSGPHNVQDNDYGDCVADLPRLYVYYSSPWACFF